MQVLGVGISSELFLQQGIFPLLRSLGTNRRELIQALQRSRQRAKRADDAPEPVAAGGAG
jgi:hypothetical protein